MRNLQDYINKYYTIAQNLGYTGDSIEVLVQLLANASYISEVENVAYLQESSLEKSSLINSKIQHCMDNMYSVFRGLCPRVVMKIRPTSYLTLKPFDLIQQSSSFSVYYLGYYKLIQPSSNIGLSSSSRSVRDSNVISSSVISSSSESSGQETSSMNRGTEEVDYSSLSGLDSLNPEKYPGEFIYSGVTLKPSVSTESYIIICLISPTVHQVDKMVNTRNTYYIDCPIDNLSNDVLVKVNGEQAEVTRNFADHILKPSKYVFDLTLPSFGSRIYTANYFSTLDRTDRSDSVGIEINTRINATYFEWSRLEDYNQSELRRLSYKGAELVGFNDTWLKANMYSELSQGSGLCFVKEVGRDDLNTIHYKANRNRYVNSMVRSNNDIGTILEENFPQYVKNGGTSYVFNTLGNNSGSELKIYYIPKDESRLIPDTSDDPGKSVSSISDFIEKEQAYYIITKNIKVEKGERYTAEFNISLELYRNSTEDLNGSIGSILKSTYERKFNTVFNDTTIEEVKSLISKFSNIKRINSLGITFLDSRGQVVEMSDIDPIISYFDITYNVSTLVSHTPSN
jgi:hypothetical protein